ncbi:hypothetical protein D3C71_2091330 [compost metagenome]
MNRLHLVRDLSRLQMRQEGQLLDHAVNPYRVIPDILQVLFITFRLDPVLHSFDITEHAGQRHTQIMRNIGKELLPPLLGVKQSVI